MDDLEKRYGSVVEGIAARCASQLSSSMPPSEVRYTVKSAVLDGMRAYRSDADDVDERMGEWVRGFYHGMGAACAGVVVTAVAALLLKHAGL